MLSWHYTFLKFWRAKVSNKKKWWQGKQNIKKWEFARKQMGCMQDEYHRVRNSTMGSKDTKQSYNLSNV